MIRGFYTALSGVMAAMTRQAVVADNIANVSTVGFKQSRTTQNDFEQEIMNTLGPQLGELGTGTLPTNLRLDISQGPLQVTGLQTDLAIEGDGLFVVSYNGGRAYTRAGDFQRDVNGMLVTEQGFPVLDTAGRTITVPQVFNVAQDGTIVETGQRLAFVSWPGNTDTRLGQNLYAEGGATPATGRIHQGVLEGSNTDLALGMSELISLQRSFQLSSRALSLQDGTIGDAISLGRLR